MFYFSSVRIHQTLMVTPAMAARRPTDLGKDDLTSMVEQWELPTSAVNTIFVMRAYGIGKLCRGGKSTQYMGLSASMARPTDQGEVASLDARE